MWNVLQCCFFRETEGHISNCKPYVVFKSWCFDAATVALNFASALSRRKHALVKRAAGTQGSSLHGSFAGTGPLHGRLFYERVLEVVLAFRQKGARPTAESRMTNAANGHRDATVSG